MEFGNINLLAVLACGAAAMVVGFIWYSKPLFEGAWLAEIGRSSEQVAADPPAKFIIAFVAALLEAYILAGLLNVMGGPDLPTAVLAAVVVWAGFTVTTSATTFAFASRSTRLWLIETGAHLVTVLAMAVILGLWV